MTSDAGLQPDSVWKDVQDYYGKRVKTTDDLMTGCCTMDLETFSKEARAARKLIHPEVLSKNYGCGAVYPEAVAGCKVLDLGSGAGLDCFVLSKMVGPEGHVTGVDMTKEQLEVARKHIGYHTEAFGFPEPNVDFLEGFIESLEGAGLQEETFDIIVSNCVINLSPDKKAVLKEAYRVLKAGGEMYFSDIYSSQPVPESLKENKVLWGECISGAYQWSQLVEIAMEIGFAPPVLVTSTLYRWDDQKLVDLIGSSGCEGLQFCSATYRLMKIPRKEEEKEETLNEVKYKGTISGHESRVKFSCQVTLEVDCPVVLPSSVSTLLQACPRLSPHFTIGPLTAPEGATPTPLTPPLADFVNINPFKMSSKTVALAPPKAQSCDTTSGCCGSTTTTNPASSTKTGCDATPSETNGGCCGNGTEPPPAKRSCC